MQAKDLMTAPVLTTTPCARLREVAALLLERAALLDSRGIRRVPVLRGVRLVGISDDPDLGLRA